MTKLLRSLACQANIDFVRYTMSESLSDSLKRDSLKRGLKL